MTTSVKTPIHVVVQGHLHEATFERYGDRVIVDTVYGSRMAPLRKFRPEELAQLVALALISSHLAVEAAAIGRRGALPS